MSTARILVRALSLAALVAAGISCAGDRATGLPATAASRLGTPSAATPTLLECDAPAEAQTATAIIGPLGGALSIGATRVVIPEGAVLAPTDFRLTVPASRLVEISVRAGSAEHFLFARPVLVSIDYGRCAGSAAPDRPLSAWHIDETSKALLENMRGVDVRALHTVTFLTGHLSGYAVAD